jgi:hypothetical protein
MYIAQPGEIGWHDSEAVGVLAFWLQNRIYSEARKPRKRAQKSEVLLALR